MIGPIEEMATDMMSMAEFREVLGSVQHEIWAHWMEYLFSVSKHNRNGSVTIPADKVTRWAEQMKTHYVLLSAKEQKSDQEQADKVIDAMIDWRIERKKHEN